LAGTFAPCSGWTSISAFSPLSRYTRYAHTSLPGHWGPQLKFAGFDQLIIKGKAEKPFYLSIEGEKVSFEEAKHLRGKDTVETTVTIQEEKEDRDIDVLCTGPAGENLVYFANVTNRLTLHGKSAIDGRLKGMIDFLGRFLNLRENHLFFFVVKGRGEPYDPDGRRRKRG